MGLFFTGSALLLLLGIAFWRLVRQGRECRFQSKIIAATGCSVVMTDATASHHPVTHVNPAFRLLTGYEDSEIVGKTMAILAGPGTDRTSVEKLELALQQGMACRVCLRHYRKDGTPFLNEITLSPVTGRAGRLSAMMWVMIDVTRCQREEECGKEGVDNDNEQAMQFKLALESAPCGMLMVGQDGGISRVNTRIEQMFGYRGEELLGKPVEFLIPALHQAARTGWVSASAVRPMGVGRELSGLRKDGSECPIEIGLNPLSMASGTSVLATVIDITDRKKAEASLRHAAKLTAISTLSGGMAHEFNNSLTAVLGFSHLALPLIPNDNKAHYYVQQVLSAGMESRELVHQLLTFSRQSDQVRHPLPLQLLVKEAIRPLRSTIPSSIKLKAQIDASTSPVLADMAQMHQMIMNLADNAIYAMRKTGGTLEFRLQDQEIEVDHVTPSGRLVAGRYACLTVRDSGEGLEPAVADQIFEPFFAAKPLGEGQGMGLSVAHGIVAAHGGTVVVNSQIDVGTVVSVYIPALFRSAAEERSLLSREGVDAVSSRC